MTQRKRKEMEMEYFRRENKGGVECRRDDGDKI